MIRTQRLTNDSNIGSFLTCADEFIRLHKDDDFYDDGWTEKELFYNICAGRTHMQTFISFDEYNKTLGFIMGSEYIRKVYEIRNHFILPEYRGNGIGSVLKRTLTQYAKSSGYLLMLSDVSKSNSASIGLNESQHWIRKELDEDTWRYMKKL